MRTQVMQSRELTIAFSSHRFSESDSKREPTKKECIAVLYAVAHLKQYLSGRHFTLVTDCLALTWLFQSR